MMLFNHVIKAISFLSLFTPLSLAQSLYNKPCPIFGPSYPIPQRYAASTYMQTALKGLNDSMSKALHNQTTYGQLDSKTTAFTFDIYSLHEEEPLFTYHLTPDALVAQHTTGVQTVDSYSVFRIGSISKLYTTFIYLIAEGDTTWNEPITKFVPELAAFAERTSRSLDQNAIDIVDWSSITVGALASQLAGVPRGSAYSVALEHVLESLGFPPPKHANISMCGDDARARIPCTREGFFADYLTQHPVELPFQTPVYSDGSWQILSYALENITGKAMADLFQDSFVKPLGLEGTYYTVPPSENTSFIPINSTISWWNADLVDQTPGGGYYSNINDMRKIGKAILNSTLLTPAQTRRWMKPHSFISNKNASVGAPWEIFLAPGDPTTFLYTKSGNLGMYASMQVLIPDFNVGFNVLAAGSDSDADVRIICDMVTDAIMPGLRATAKSQATSIYSGTYEDKFTNSSMTIITIGSDPGLVVKSWKLGNLDILSLLGQLEGVNPKTQSLNIHLYPAITNKNGTITSWRAGYEKLPQTLDPGVFSTNCVSWGQLDTITYGGIGLDEFIFTLNSDKSAAESVQARVLGDNLSRVSGQAVSKLMRRQSQ